MKALNEETSEFNPGLTPMIDVVFLLLVFFLVSTSFVKPEKSVAVKLPVADEAEKSADQEGTLVVNVLETGLLSARGRILAGYDELVQIIKSAREVNPDVLVVIRGDESTQFRNVVRVMNAALEAGIGETSIAVFDTEP